MIITACALLSGYAFVSAEEFSFESPSLGFYAVKILYHEQMNDYFNKKIGAFVDTELDDPAQFPPTDGGICTEENVSTYCVSMGALDRYVAYMKTLNGVSSTVLSLSKDIPMTPGAPTNLLTSILSAATSTDDLIKKERNDSLSTMEATINAYNEFRMAYPMHLKYKEIISDLYKYRDLLSDFRSKVSSFPAEFSSVTSDSCK